ncbi:hypothetical protein [Tenacibaculum geojense]|uniref:Fibronectin type-III domain-containing protein n=1 Tax=Tenacibaculum geojense TaxID=915352 RepID=A0ABW3JTT6_9FLAO
MKTIFFLKALLILLTTFLFSNCNNNDEFPEDIINITILNNKEETFTSMKIEVTSTYEGQNEIIERGIAYSTNTNPTINDNIIIKTNNTYTASIFNLTANTTYHFRAYIKTDDKTTYSDEKTFKTLSLDDTSWKVTTVYPNSNNYEIISQVDFLQNGTTKFDEIDFPGTYTTLGTWSLNGNNLTYIWEGNNSNNSTYIYYGVLSGMSIEGTYSHIHLSDGIWSATPL